MSLIKVGILTISDSCSKNEAKDTSGDNLSDLVQQLFTNAIVEKRACVPDEQDGIISILKDWSDNELVNLILTTGGTGFSPRDVTPEAVASIIEKNASGFVTAMISKSYEITPLAILSRPVAGIRKNTLIVTLPGSKKGSQECFQIIAKAIPHAIDLMLDRKQDITNAHHLLKEQHINHRNQHNHHSHHHHQHGHHDHHHHHQHSHHQHMSYKPGHSCVHHSNQHAGDQSSADVTKVSRRDRKSPYPMISVKEALNTILKYATPNKIVEKTLEDALGYVLAEDIISEYPLPPFPASIKDGYAVIAADGDGLREVIGGSTAGSMPQKLQISSGKCVRINTGAPVPLGADAVVQVEDTELTKSSEDGKEEFEIKILKKPKLGEDIRPIGCDISKGEIILSKSTVLNGPELGIISSVGISNVKVFDKTTVALLSTGNELQEPGEPLKEGYIYDSNKTTLRSYLKQHNIPTFNAGIATDDPNDLYNKLKKSFDHCDVVVTTGSVSMGEKDILRPVLIADFNATIHFAQVFMKPGKPTTFATCDYNGKGKLILGLPGNPVSATVTSYLYILPLCLKLSAHQHYLPQKISVKLSSDIYLDPRPEYHRAVLKWIDNEEIPYVESTGNQLSSRLLSFNSAQALIILPPSTQEKKYLPKGEIVKAYLLTLPYQ